MKKLILFFSTVLLLLCSCSYSVDDAKSTCTLYYLDAENDNQFVSVPGKLNALTAEDAITEALLKLKSPENKKLLPAVPGDIKILSLSVTETICTAELSSRYEKLPDTTKAATSACLVKTICSIDSIDRVILLCNGVVAGDFTENDFLINSPRTYYDIYTVNLYFANAAFDGLQADREIISLVPDTTLEQTVMSRLLSSSSSGKLRSAVPEGTRLNDVYVSEGVCVVDLSREFIDNVVHDELHEGIAIYSIVNTMTELPMIDSVKILVDGKDTNGYLYYKLSLPLTNNSKLFPTQAAEA